MPETKLDTQPAANVPVKSEEKAPPGTGPITDSGTPTDGAQTDAKPEQRTEHAREGTPEEKKAEPQTELKPGPKPEPKLDPDIKTLVKAQVEAQLESALEAKVDALLEVNRQLAAFLGEQMEIAIRLRQSVLAMERLIEGDARRKAKYAALLEQVKGEGDGMADPHWINRTRGLLSQLKRTGTTGPKIESETGRS